MKTIVIYKTKYGSAKTYAQWIGEELSCKTVDARDITVQELEAYDNIIYGGGLYACSESGRKSICIGYKRGKTPVVILGKIL